MAKYLRYMIYSLLTYLGQILNVVAAILVRKFLSPSDMGTLTLAQTLYGYLDLAHGGARFALDKEIPMSNEEEHEKIFLETFRLAMMLYLSTVMGTFFFSFYYF